MIGERVGAVIVAAGRSERMGFDKVWSPLGGEPVLAHSLRAMAEARVDAIALVVAREQVSRAESLAEDLGVAAIVTPGGDRRRDSVRAGLEALEGFAWIVVHDAARPLVSTGLVYEGLRAARRSGAVVPVVAVTDTIKRVADDRVLQTVPREDLRLVQTPQVFRRDLLAWALSVCDDDVSDEAVLIERLGGIVYTFQGDPQNVKLTYPGDLTMAERMLARVNPGS